MSIYFLVILPLSLILMVVSGKKLLDQHTKLIEERDKALDDLAKLKMLNKLKVDWDEKPIIWEEMK